MRTLYHLWLSPESRLARFLLAEKELEFDMMVEKTWESREDFLHLNPAGQVPVLVDEDRTICGCIPLIEYLVEAYPNPNLMGTTTEERLETRRLIDWFQTKFNQEVAQLLLAEKVMKRFLKLGAPQSSAIRAGQHNIHIHLSYVNYLTERRRFLAGEAFSLADIAAAAHLSCIDYLGDVPWDKYKDAKEWYTKVKSRPAFRPLLGDHIPGMPPPKHYADLDF